MQAASALVLLVLLLFSGTSPGLVPAPNPLHTDLEHACWPLDAALCPTAPWNRDSLPSLLQAYPKDKWASDPDRSYERTSEALLIRNECGSVQVTKEALAKYSDVVTDYYETRKADACSPDAWHGFVVDPERLRFPEGHVPGRFHTQQSNPAGPGYPSHRKEVALDDAAQWILSERCNDDRNTTRACTLLMSNGLQQWPLVSWHERHRGSDPVEILHSVDARAIFSGDLDRDGRPELLLEIGTYRGGAHATEYVLLSPQPVGNGLLSPRMIAYKQIVP